MRAAPLAALLLVASLPLVGGGCSADKRVKDVERQLAACGLRLEEFRAIEPDRLHATGCRAGRIERLHALLCSYSKAADLARGHRAAEGWIGLALTGSWAEHQLAGEPPCFVRLVLADRAASDVEGASMSRVLMAFEGVK